MDLHEDLALLAEPTRLRLLALLGDEELSVSELTQITQLPQSTVSRHLRTLKDAVWVRRRAEGNSGWFRQPRMLPPQAAALWEVVSTRHADTPGAGEDRERLKAVLEARRVDSPTFFGRMHGQWDGLRTELYGTSFVIPALLGLLPGEQVVVELGCGTGPNLPPLATCVGKVIGVDREARMLDAARERTADLSNVELRLGGLEALPLHDGEADQALCVLVLHHVEDLAAAFIEIARVVRPGGQVAITDMRLHRRTAYRDTMGHVHLGFDEATLVACLPSELTLVRWRELPVDPDAQGPGLFSATLERK